MRFDVIAADPPWHYNERKCPGARYGLGVHGQYPTMRTPDICRLPVPGIAARDAVLLLWATFPKLPDAMQVIEAWKFNYKTIAFVWIKTNPGRARLGRLALAQRLYSLGLDGFLAWLVFFGVGHYTKSNAELCLLATRGATLTPVSNSVSSVIITPRGRHSAKPAEAYMRARELFGPARSYLEMFARTPRPGWVVLGNEVDGQDIRQALQSLRLAERKPEAAQ